MKNLTWQNPEQLFVAQVLINKVKSKCCGIKVYITAKIIWNFLFYNTDFHENRAHVHVGKRGTEELCKIWLEPEVEMAKQGDLTDKQAKEVLDIAKRYQTKLLYQWKQFKEGKTIRIIKIKK